MQRLKERFEENGITFTLYNTSRVPKKEDNIVAIRSAGMWLLGQFLHSRESIIHQHGSEPISLGLLSLLAITRRKAAVVSLQSFRYDIGHLSLLHRLAFSLAKKARLYFIAVAPHIKQKLTSLGIRAEDIEVVPQFIPPTIREEEIIEIPQEVWRFIDSHTPVISANAFQISFYNNQDLYGIDMCIDLCADLKDNYPRIGFVLCLPDIRDYDYFHKMKQWIKQKGIEKNFLFQTKPCQFYPVLMKSDAFVRPTNTDGDAVSIREALFLKIPSIVSDVVPRPEETILFRNRDITDLTLKVREVLDNYDQYKRRLEGVKLEDNFQKIVKVYDKLLKVELTK